MRQAGGKPTGDQHRLMLIFLSRIHPGNLEIRGGERTKTIFYSRIIPGFDKQ
jgi:hypothetical protein